MRRFTISENNPHSPRTHNGKNTWESHTFSLSPQTILARDANGHHDHIANTSRPVRRSDCGTRCRKNLLRHCDYAPTLLRFPAFPHPITDALSLSSECDSAPLAHWTNTLSQRREPRSLPVGETTMKNAAVSQRKAQRPKSRSSRLRWPFGS